MLDRKNLVELIDQREFDMKNIIDKKKPKIDYINLIPIILSMLRRVIFFIPLLYILPHVFNLGVLGVWIALPLANFIASLVAMAFLIKDSKFSKEINKIHNI